MRSLMLATVTVAAALSASLPAMAQDHANFTDANGPIRQGTLCKQRIQPSQPDGLALFLPCTDNQRTTSKPQRTNSGRTSLASGTPEYQQTSNHIDANGPIRQGTMCKQRIQPSQPDGLAFFAPCTN